MPAYKSVAGLPAILPGSVEDPNSPLVLKVSLLTKSTAVGSGVIASSILAPAFTTLTTKLLSTIFLTILSTPVCLVGAGSILVGSNLVLNLSVSDLNCFPISCCWFMSKILGADGILAVSYTHLRAHET